MAPELPAFVAAAKEHIERNSPEWREFCAECYPEFNPDAVKEQESTVWLFAGWLSSLKQR